MRRALVIVDPEKCFCKDGSLAVPGADDIMPVVNKMIDDFKKREEDVVVITQDWHTADHGSFASNNEGKEPFEMGELDGQPQMMWPDHGVQNTEGAEFHDALKVSGIPVFQKGQDKNVDSYSAFYDNNGKNPTGLADYLRQNNIDKVYVCGLATDYCVKFTALDSVKEGFDTVLVADACRGVSEDSSSDAIVEMAENDITILESGDIK